MTSASILSLIFLSLSGENIHINLYPSLEIGGGYDSNILFESAGKTEGFFNQTSSSFGLDLKLTEKLGFFTDYEILYTNYSAGSFSSLDNFLAAGLTVRPFGTLSLKLLGQWEAFDPNDRPEYRFTRLVAFPSIEGSWGSLILRTAFYYSLIEFQDRPVVAPFHPTENQTDTEMETFVFIGYTFGKRSAASITYSYIETRSNLIEDERHTLDSYGNSVTLNIWQALWRKARLNLRFQTLFREFEDNPINPIDINSTMREDELYKASLIFRQGLTEYLEGFVSLSYLQLNSNNSAEEFTRTFIFVGFSVLFDPVRMDRQWREVR